MKKRMILLLMISALLSWPMNSYAAEKIKSVSLKIDAEVDEEFDDFLELDITAKNKRYTVDSYEILNDLEEEDEDSDGPGMSDNSAASSSKRNSGQVFSCEITLSADEGYVFDTFKKSDIKLSGFDADCIKASRKDSGKTLLLTVELPGIQKVVRNVESVGWNDAGRGHWTSAENATTYILKLYRNGRLRGTYETGGTTFDFSPAMLKEGTYYFTVRAMDGESRSKQCTESDAVQINDETVKNNLEAYALVYDETIKNAGPTDQVKPINGGWQQDEVGYWYRLDNGMYPQANWLQLGNDWYYFDEAGYLVTSDTITWKGITYHLDSDGRARH